MGTVVHIENGSAVIGIIIGFHDRLNSINVKNF